MMEIRPTADQEEFIRQAVEAGRIERPEEAVMQALALWEERERRRIEILCRIDEAENSLARGEGIAVTPETMRALAQDVKRRGRARLEAEGSAAR
jgi:Arc/MetJ-type ribon-helix-helix transcriptional regulator